MILKTKLLGKIYEFPDIRTVMAKANEEKSGDSLAGIGAENAAERVAAKVVLSQLTLGELRNHPAVPYEQDEVTRIIQDDVNEVIYNSIKNWTVGEFREWLLDENAATPIPVSVPAVNAGYAAPSGKMANVEGLSLQAVTLDLGSCGTPQPYQVERSFTDKKTETGKG